MEGLPASILDLAGDAIGLHDQIFYLSRDTLEVVRNELLVSESLMQPERIERLITVMLKAVELRPKQVQHYAKLLHMLMESDIGGEVKDRIKEILITRFFSFSFLSLCHPHQMNYSYFAYLCCKLHIINGKDILSGIQFYPLGGQMDQMAHNLSWFGPEIELVDKRFFTIHSVSLVKSRHYLLVPNIFTAELYVQGTDWETVRKQREFGHNPNPICAPIVEDDAGKLLDTLTALSMNVNTKITPSVFEPCFIVNDGATPIQYAAAMGSVECFKYLLINGADLEEKDSMGRSITQFAVYGGNIEIIRILEDRGISFSNCLPFAVQYHRNDILTWIMSSGGVPMSHLNSILMNAAIANNVEAAIIGFETGNNVNGRDPQTHECVLTNTAIHGSLDVMELLLNHGDVQTAVRGRFGSPLQTAVQFGYIEMTRQLMEYDIDAVDRITEQNTSCLHTAAEQNFARIIDILLEKRDININVEDPVLKSAFHLATVSGNVKAVKSLMAHPNININAIDADGRLPYFASVVANNVDMVKLIMSDDRSRVCTHDGDCTALVFAIRNSLSSIMNILLSRQDCGVNGKFGAQRKTPLMVAIEDDIMGAVSLLLQQPSLDINATDAQGRTALHYACMKKKKAFARMILNVRVDVDVNKRDRNGYTPLHTAVSCGQKGPINVLRQHPELDIYVTDHDGKTALSLAIATNATEIVEILPK